MQSNSDNMNLSIQEISLSLSSERPEGPNRRRSIDGQPRRRNKRRSVGVGRDDSTKSLSTTATGATSAISYESSDDTFFDELSAIIDISENGTSKIQNNQDDIINKEFSTDNQRTVDRRETLLRDMSGLSLGSVAEDLLREEEQPVLAIKRVQSRLLDKHIKTGRLTSAASSVDMRRRGASHNQLTGLAGHRRVRTTLSFGKNLASADALGSSPEPTKPSLKKNDSFKALSRSGTGNSNKSAVSAGRALLGR